ncbi:hypothetical protein tb265_02330 [Gemmatimonadetes bacterium T265]|nr:hypothetical protein tb265_02330 [Gemmatimonadetes bacterium T265]
MSPLLLRHVGVRVRALAVLLPSVAATAPRAARAAVARPAAPAVASDVAGRRAGAAARSRVTQDTSARQYSAVAVLLDHRAELALTAAQVARLDSLDQALGDRNRPLVPQLEAARGHAARLRSPSGALQRNNRDAIAAARTVLGDAQMAQAQPLLDAWRTQLRAHLLGDVR